MSIESLDSLALAEKIQNKEISPEELINVTFQKVAKKNPALNAIIHERKDKAINEAKNLTYTGQPFFGLPIFTKDLGQSLVGEPLTSGAHLLKGNVATETDNFVKALQEKAGFIIVGSTNTPEFGFKNITDPTLYGPTRNPHNLDYSSGGSSGGAAAVVAAGISPIASASDGGGSIRIPASFSGLIGLKPTRGRVPVGPNEWRNWQGASINFALTKSVRDTAAMLDTMKIAQPTAVFQTPLPEKDYSIYLEEKTTRFRIAFSTNSPVDTIVSNEAKQAVLNAVRFLESQGHEVTEQDNPLDGIKMMKSYYVMNAGETAAMMKNISRGIKRNIVISDMELMSWTLYQTGKHISAADYIDALNTWDQASAQMANFHESYDLFLTPTTADHAPKVNAKLQTDLQIAAMKNVEFLPPQEQQKLVYDMFLQSLTITPFTQQANLTGQPAISLPTHTTNIGLPLGIQFTAPKGKEEWLLQIAKEFETAQLFNI